MGDCEIANVSNCRAAVLASRTELTVLMWYTLGSRAYVGNDTSGFVCLCRWMAADLYLREVDILRFEVRPVEGPLCKIQVSAGTAAICRSCTDDVITIRRACILSRKVGALQWHERLNIAATCSLLRPVVCCVSTAVHEPVQ